MRNYYEEVKNNLTMKAIPINGNEFLIQRAPHKLLGDEIAIIYQIELGGNARALVTSELLETLGITTDRLIKDAEEIAPKRKPVVISSMGAMLGIPDYELPLLVATTEDMVYGAGILGYPGFFEDAARKIGGSFYIMPSSIHEVLLLKDDGCDPDTLNAIISSVNHDKVSPKERLGWKSLRYDVETKSLR